MSGVKIVVCVKEVQGELNPFDACAVECALQLSDDVTVVSMGRMSAKDILLRLTRLGCKAILLSDPAFAGADTLATSYALSRLIQKMNPQLVICGRQSIDGDTAQTGPALATALGLPFASNVMSMSLSGNTLSTQTRTGDVELVLPALVTVERINTLRFPKLTSRLGEVSVLNADDIGADKSRCGLTGSPTRVMKTFESAVGKRKCRFISKDEMMDLLKNAKNTKRTSFEVKESENKLPLVWCVGHEVEPSAKRIAKAVKVIERDNPQKLAEIIRTEQPDVVLWPADLWGLSAAPVVQAMLETGLCADCTALETDGKELFMYRPAFSGTLTAKIRCTTKPVMATVRTADQSSCNIVVGCGKGAVDHLDAIHRFAQSIGAENGASRGLVDAGLAPYDQQIGLTGKTIGSSVYLAVGISGAVHHTCALDRVGTVIAVNPDKNARIFEYADYGVLATAEEIFEA